jgi:hypothetical protein
MAKMGRGVEVPRQQLALVVKTRAANVVIDLLQANQVGVLLLDHVDDARQVVAAIAAADSFVDVVAQKPHGSREFTGRRTKAGGTMQAYY